MPEADTIAVPRKYAPVIAALIQGMSEGRFGEADMPDPRPDDAAGWMAELRDRLAERGLLGR